MQKTAQSVGPVPAIAIAALLGLTLLLMLQVRSLKNDIDAARSSLSDLKETLVTGNPVAAEGSVLVTNMQVVVTNTQVVVTNHVGVSQIAASGAPEGEPFQQIGTNAQYQALVSSFQVRSNEWRKIKQLAEIEAEEARFALKQVAERNKKIVKEKLALQKQVASLSASLSLEQAKNEEDRLKKATEMDAAEVGASIDVASDNDASLFDGRVTGYDETLGMVILSLGTKHGVKPRMQFSVMNQGRWVARVRVVDPRRALSGAEIEDVVDGRVPQVGDRIIPWKSDKTDGS